MQATRTIPEELFKLIPHNSFRQAEKRLRMDFFRVTDTNPHQRKIHVWVHEDEFKSNPERQRLRSTTPTQADLIRPVCGQDGRTESIDDALSFSQWEVEEFNKEGDLCQRCYTVLEQREEL